MSCKAIKRLSKEIIILTYHCVLLVLNGPDSDFSEEVIMEKMCGKVRFDGQAFCKELLVEVLASLLTHQHASTPVIFSRTTGPTHHLQYVHDRIVDIAMLFSFVELYAHDDDHVASHGDAPRSVLMKL